MLQEVGNDEPPREHCVYGGFIVSGEVLSHEQKPSHPQAFRLSE